MTFIENNQVMNTNKKRSIKVIYIIQKGRYRFIFYANGCVLVSPINPEHGFFENKKRSNGKYHKTLSKQTFTYWAILD